MATGILAIGEPGTGKSAAIRNLNHRETVIISPNTKDLPFPGAAKKYQLNNNFFLRQTLKGIGDTLVQLNNATHIKTAVIEDFTHYVAKRVIDERDDKGYDKWTELAASIKIHIIDKLPTLRPDLFIILVGHVEATSDTMGIVSINLQTPGKLLDRAVKISSHFTYVLHTFVDQDKKTLEVRYNFLTNRDMIREAKTPMGMFPLLIDNDYNAVIERIKAYRVEEGITPIGISLEDMQRIKKGGTPRAAPATAAPKPETAPAAPKAAEPAD